MHAIEKLRASTAPTNTDASTEARQDQLLTTKQLPPITGFSKSYFEKARGRGYGPAFLRVVGSGKHGKVLYRRSAVEAWLNSHLCQ